MFIYRLVVSMQGDTNKMSKKKTPDTVYDLFFEAFPRFRSKNGKFSPRRLAVALDINTQAVYKWLDANKVPSRQVKELIRVSDGSLSYENLAPFVFT